MTFYIVISCLFGKVYISRRSKPFKGILTVKQLHSIFFNTFNSYFMRIIFPKKKNYKTRNFKIKLYQRNQRTSNTGQKDTVDTLLKSIDFNLETKHDYYTLLYNNTDIKLLVLQPLLKCMEEFRTEIEEKYFQECIDIL